MLIRNYELLIHNYGLIIRNFELLIRIYGLLISNHELEIRNYELVIRYYAELLICNYELRNRRPHCQVLGDHIIVQSICAQNHLI